VEKFLSDEALEVTIPNTIKATLRSTGNCFPSIIQNCSRDRGCCCHRDTAVNSIAGYFDIVRKVKAPMAPIGVVIILERHCDSGSNRQIGQIGEVRRPIRSVNSTASCRKIKNPFFQLENSFGFLPKTQTHNPKTQVLASPNRIMTTTHP
jgi:hypothetical protein